MYFCDYEDANFMIANNILQSTGALFKVTVGRERAHAHTHMHTLPAQLPLFAFNRGGCARFVRPCVRSTVNNNLTWDTSFSNDTNTACQGSKIRS